MDNWMKPLYSSPGNNNNNNNFIITIIIFCAVIKIKNTHV